MAQFAITDIDTDADGIVDLYEKIIGLNPKVASSITSDVDRDKLTDFFEAMTGTNPRVLDSDRDGFSDGFEVYTNSDPLNPSCTPIAGCKYSTFMPVIRK